MVIPRHDNAPGRGITGGIVIARTNRTDQAGGYTMTELSAEQASALAIAHHLVDMGVPVFPAPRDNSLELTHRMPFMLPNGWQTWRPNHSAVDRWRPGWALAMVTGVVFDVLDVDPRNGGLEGFAELLAAGAFPESYGVADTPSQGNHYLIERTHLAKGKPAEGVDLQAGDERGEGRGFIFIAPTVRVSRWGDRLGQEVAYRWSAPPEGRRLEAYTKGSPELGKLIDLATAKRTQPARWPLPRTAFSNIWDEAEDWTVEAAQRVVDGQLEAVHNAKVGEVNGTLGGAARVLGRFVGGGWLDQDTVSGWLVAALEAGGVHSDDWNRANGVGWVAESVIQRALAQGKDEPWTVAQDVPAPVADEGQEAPSSVPGMLPSPREPMRVARVLAPHYARPLTWWRGDFYQWMGTHWEMVAEPEVIQWIYQVTENATYLGANTKGEPEPKAWAPTRTRVGDVTHALGHGVLQRTEPAEQVMALANGVLRGRRLEAHTSDRFNLTALPFEYDPEAACPEWHKFLDSTLPGDRLTQDFLAEWMGYVLSGRTDMQKMAVLIGPRRSGKGTATRVLEAMVGPTGYAAPTMAGLGGSFGLASLIGKSLAVMGDVRWTSKHVIEAVPVLLGIVGRDGFTVARKHRDDWVGQLPARVMLVSNDAPSFTDASNALSGRMVYASFEHSFYGREDLGLEARLMQELPGILNWALDGLDRLTLQGHFSQSSASMEVRSEVDRDSSPVTAWVEDRCVLDPTSEMTLDALLESYMQWITSQRMGLSPSAGRLSRELRSAFGDKGVTIVRKNLPRGGRYQSVTGIRVIAGASIVYDEA